MTSKETVNDFVSQKNLAIIGVSRNPKKFGNYIYKELKSKDYNVFAINPNMNEFEGDKVFHSLDQLPSQVDAVLLSIPPAKAKEALKEVAKQGIKRVWLQQGSSNKDVIKTCDDLGLKYVSNECIMMYTDPVNSIHKFHRAIWKLIGKYAK
jgi:hypothetical protein